MMPKRAPTGVNRTVPSRCMLIMVSTFAAAAVWGNPRFAFAQGTVVAWGSNSTGACNVPAPNYDFMAVAGGRGS